MHFSVLRELRSEALITDPFWLGMSIAAIACVRGSLEC